LARAATSFASQVMAPFKNRDVQLILRRRLKKSFGLRRGASSKEVESLCWLLSGILLKRLSASEVDKLRADQHDHPDWMTDDFISEFRTKQSLAAPVPGAAPAPDPVPEAEGPAPAPAPGAAAPAPAPAPHSSRALGHLRTRAAEKWGREDKSWKAQQQCVYHCFKEQPEALQKMYLAQVSSLAADVPDGDETGDGVDDAASNCDTPPKLASGSLRAQRSNKSMAQFAKNIVGASKDFIESCQLSSREVHCIKTVLSEASSRSQMTKLSKQKITQGIAYKKGGVTLMKRPAGRPHGTPIVSDLELRDTVAPSCAPTSRVCERLDLPILTRQLSVEQLKDDHNIQYMARHLRRRMANCKLGISKPTNATDLCEACRWWDLHSSKLIHWEERTAQKLTSKRLNRERLARVASNKKARLDDAVA
jgi:hypothetical protein